MAKSRKITYVFGADISELERGWKRIDYKLKNLSRDIRRHGMAMSKAFTVPLAAVGGIATKAALDVDKAFQTIARGTGAQGENLKSFQNEWKELAVSVTQSYEVSAKVLADYNTRLGLTGEALREISKQALDAARMMEEDVNAIVAESAKAMQSWNVEAENMSGFMDRLFKASQSTGVGIARLSEQLYRYGASLRGMGFDLESSIALLANFEREGVNLERVMSSLSQGLSKMARAGITDAEQAFTQLIREIQNAENSTEATRIAVEVFGRSGADMADAIREGRFELSDLINVLRDAEGAINDAAEKTETFGDKMNKLGKSINMALEPLGQEILNIANKIMPSLQQAASDLASSISDMSETSKTKVVELAVVLGLGGPLLIAISAAINAVRNLAGVVLAAFSIPGAPWILATASVLGLVHALKEFDKTQKEITGRAPAEVLDRAKYMQQAGEIYAQRHGKYPLTVKEYEELDKIIDELIAKDLKQKTKALPENIKTTAPAKGPVEVPEISPVDLSALFKTNEKLKSTAEEAAKAAKENARQVAAVTAAEIERLEKVKRMQLEAQEAAAEGVAKFWQDMNWEYQQGLLDAQTYFEMLQNELNMVTQGSEQWKDAFERIQMVAMDIARTNLDTLNEQLQTGKITTDEFNESVLKLKEQFQDLPLVVEALNSSLKTTSESSKEMVDFASDLGMTFQSAFENAIIEGENFRRVLSGLLEDIARIILRMYVVRPLVNSVMGFMTTSFGLPAIKMHSGGVVGLAGTPVTVPASAFIGAPRLHNGLAPDEFPAILQRGETVIPRGGTVETTPPNVKIVNVLDPSIVGNYLNTAEGERVVVNIMQKNIRRVV